MFFNLLVFSMGIRGGIRKSFLAMVTPQTIVLHVTSRFLATGADSLGKLWVKTVWDLLSDVLSLRQGDLVYFVRYASGDSESILGTWKVEKLEEFSSTVFFDPRPWRGSLENYVFRVKLREVNMWDDYLPTDYLFSLPQYFGYLWSLGGKKALGRGKSLTTLPPGGGKVLETVYYEFKERANEEGWKSEPVKLTVDGCSLEEYSPDSNTYHLDKEWFLELFRREEDESTSPSISTCLGEVDITSLPVRKGHLLANEKVLEAWFSMFVDQDEMEEFWKQLELKKESIVWFSNYLPLTISGKNVDFVVLLEDKPEKTYSLVVIELKKDELYGKRGRPLKKLEEAINEVNRYAPILRNLFRENLKFLLRRKNNDKNEVSLSVKKVVVGAKNPEAEEIVQKLQGDVHVFTYEIVDDNVPLKIEKVSS